MNLSAATTETVLAEPLLVQVGFDGAFPLKAPKDAGWRLAGSLTLKETGEQVPLEDPACLGESLPVPEQDAEGKWVSV